MMTVPFSYKEVATPFKARNDLLSFIKEVHRQQHGLAGEDIHGIAAAWGSTPSEIYGIATFYSFLGARRRGLNTVKVCKSTPCCMKHCDMVAAEAQRELGISDGQTTADGLFSLVMVDCIGQCDDAPAMMVNDDVYQGVTAGRVKDILGKYREARGA